MALDLDIIAGNIEIQLKFADKVKFRIGSDDIGKLKDYLEKKDYNVEIISESTVYEGIGIGINMFRHYAVVSKNKQQ